MTTLCLTHTKKGSAEKESSDKFLIDYDKINKEYDTLKTISYADKKFFSNSHSLAKDRYKDIKPFEENRVKLADGYPHDYINASFISSWQSSENTNSVPVRQFIACQAPLKSTVCDFWNMIWQQKSTIIVMLTPTIENDQQKSFCYWPAEKETYQCGNILVYHKKSFTLKGDIIVRSLLIRHKNDSKVREVAHLHYLGWPDHGVPASPENLCNLLQLTRKFDEKKLPQDTGPIICHCAAGVGRTGVFITALLALDRVVENQDPKIFEIVTHLRKQRVGMVSNALQYAFIYQLLDSVRESTTFCAPKIGSKRKLVQLENTLVEFNK